MPMTRKGGASRADTHLRAYALSRHRTQDWRRGGSGPAVRPRTRGSPEPQPLGHDGGVDVVACEVPSISLDLPAVPASVVFASSSVGEFAAANGGEAGVVAAISIAIGQAVGTAVRRADPIAPGQVRVMADVESAELEFVVSDVARGVDAWMRFPLAS